MVPLFLADMLQGCKQLKGLLFGGINPRTAVPMLLSMYERRSKLDELVTRRYRLDGINDAITDMRAGRNIRGIIEFDSRNRQPERARWLACLGRRRFRADRTRRCSRFGAGNGRTTRAIQQWAAVASSTASSAGTCRLVLLLASTRSVSRSSRLPVALVIRLTETIRFAWPTTRAGSQRPALRRTICLHRQGLADSIYIVGITMFRVGPATALTNDFGNASDWKHAYNHHRAPPCIPRNRVVRIGADPSYRAGAGRRGCRRQHRPARLGEVSLQSLRQRHVHDRLSDVWA